MQARITHLYRSNPRLHRFYEQHDNLLWKHRAKRPMAGQWRYLAVVMDQCSRRVLGWSLARSRGARLTRAAFDLAARTRRPAGGLIFHSDRGSEYAGTTLGSRLKVFGIRQSMTRGGCPGDNAHAESFFHSLKADAIHGVRFSTDAELRACLRWYVPFYNRRRTHSSIGYLSPVEYEQRCA